MIKAILFDLDNCLSAADEPGSQLLEPVFEAIRRENQGRFSEEALSAIYFDCWRHPLDWVAARHGFPPEMLNAAWEANRQVEVTTPMRGYADLPALTALPVMKFLVTSGFQRLQERKVRALGLAHWFATVYIDAIDQLGRTGKRQIFESILREHDLAPEEVLIVGDNPDSEIEAGNQMGITTIQILRPGVPAGNNATHQIRSLDELSRFLN
jgi:putative hydrolase of the HAD superfamily